MIKHIRLLAVAFAALTFGSGAAQAQTAPDSVVIMGNLINRHYDDGSTIYNGIDHSDYGIWSITLNKDNSFRSEKKILGDYRLYSKAGAVYCDSVYYSLFQHKANSGDDYSGGENEMIVRKYSTTDWTLIETKKISADFEAADMAYDPVTDKVYGVFNIVKTGDTEDSGDNGFRLCTIDLETMKVSPITNGYLSAEYRALAVSSEGKLYGIATNGDVALFNLRNGQPSIIGNIGFKTQYQRMAATFDHRTNKMYFIGYMNTGKDPSTGKTLRLSEGRYDTGLYEVNTTNGKATLLYKFPARDQFTGIYVVGGDVKQSYDLMVENVSTPAQIKVGETGTFTARVKNLGQTTAKDYKVSLKVNGKVVDTKDGAELAPEAETTYDFSYTATIADPANSKVYFSIEDPKDTVSRNNRSLIEDVKIVLPQYPTVEIQGGENDDNTAAVIMWESPELDKPVVDGAESYAPFIIDNIGDWTMVDGDKGYTVAMGSAQGQRDYPNVGKQMAFMVFNPQEAGLSLQPVDDEGTPSQFVPYEGDQVFAAFASGVPTKSGNSSVAVQNDDWMISPELSGKAQTVSFYANSYASMGYYSEPVVYTEKLLVYYSTEGTDTASMKQVGDTISVPDKWTQFTFDVPEGAKHFAIRCVSFDQFFLFVDNIEYTGKTLHVDHYNVYSNGAKVAEVKPEDVTEQGYFRWTDSTNNGQNKYNVTVVYDEGESAFSNVINNVDTGINSLYVDKASDQNIYTLSGMRVTGKLQKGIYIRNGKKFIYK